MNSFNSINNAFKKTFGGPMPYYHESDQSFALRLRAYYAATWTLDEQHAEALSMEEWRNRLCGCETDHGFMKDDGEPRGAHDRKCGHAIILDYFGSDAAKAAAVEIAHTYALWAEQTSNDSNARYSEVMSARAFTGRKP